MDAERILAIGFRVADSFLNYVSSFVIAKPIEK